MINGNQCNSSTLYFRLVKIGICNYIAFGAGRAGAIPAFPIKFSSLNKARTMYIINLVDEAM